MLDAQLHGQGIAFPPRIGTDGQVAWSAGPDSVRESIHVILATDPGERVMLPTFGAGLRRFLHEPNVAATHRLIEDRIDHALQRWEPRIRIDRITVAADPADRQRANVIVTYTLVATGEQGRVGVGARLEG